MFGKAFLVLVAMVGVAAAFQRASHTLTADYSFEQYCEEFGKHYEGGEVELRRSLFNQKLAKVMAHNAAGRTWTETINKFSDMTHEEFKQRLGYRKDIGFTRRAMRGEIDAAPYMPVEALPTSVDWRKQGVVTAVKDQGACGSCWTFASSETLESAWAISTKKLSILSEQQICSCTSNPEDCGGSGGCEGGTPEVAYASAMTAGGLASESAYPYVSGGGQDFTCKHPLPAPTAKLTNYTVLPSNKAAPLLNAIANVGPIAIAVDAAAWGAYESGVFDGCDLSNVDLDHAVQVAGYGTDSSAGDYYLVRNSWGSDWGEDGYIRLARGDNDDTKCGPDSSPQDGVGCNGGPSTVTVCGTCGILFDTVYPIVPSSV